MKIELPDFEYGGQIPKKFTCDGEDVNPMILISDVPKEAKSLNLIVDDPDSPTGTWVHWIVKNITPDTKKISENSVPEESTEEITTFGKAGYGGPCPGSGEHRYFFKLIALNENGQEIDKAEWMGKYKRSENNIIDSF